MTTPQISGVLFCCLTNSGRTSVGSREDWSGEEFVLQKIRPFYSTRLPIGKLKLADWSACAPDSGSLIRDAWTHARRDGAPSTRVLSASGSGALTRRRPPATEAGDYVDFTQMGGFNMGISFDRFEENVKKFMELPIKYLDSAHDKAVEFMEDVHAILYPPFTDDGVPDKEDESSHHVITESSPTSVGTEQVEPDAEASTPPTSLIAVDGCVVTDAHQTESFSTKSTELAIIPQDDHAPHALETDKVTEQVGLHCSGHSDSSVYSGVISPGNSSANYEEKMILHSANYPVGVTVKDSTAISQDENVPQALHLEQVTEQAGLDCSGYSETVVGSADFVDSLLLEDSSANYEEQMVSYSANVPVEATKHGTCISHNSGTDESSCFEDPSMLTDDPVKFVDIDLMDGKIEVSSVPEQRNTSFKKMFMTSLSRKLR